MSRRLWFRVTRLEQAMREKEAPTPTGVFVSPSLAGSEEDEAAWQAWKKANPGPCIRVRTVDRRKP